MNLSPLFVAKLHWILFKGPLLCFFLAITTFYYLPIHEISWVLFFLTFIWAGWACMLYYFSSLTLTHQGMIFKTGVFIRKTTDIPYRMIETIDIEQSILGCILSYGTLCVTGSGGTRQYITPITAPLTCRRYIEQNMQSKKK